MKKEDSQVNTIQSVSEYIKDNFELLWSQANLGFTCKNTRNQAKKYVKGLLGSVQRKNGWQLAEYLGESNPYAIQYLLGRARWNAESVRDELLRYSREYLLEPKEQGVLIIDETGFLKKGTHSAGVQRQYSGTAGRIENSQIGVFLALSGIRGRTLIDRELYLPKKWCDDMPRREAASVPAEVEFATKPHLAQKMLQRAFSSGFSPQWVLADEVYGSDSKFRRFLEAHRQPYVVAVSAQQRLWVQFEQKRLDTLVKDIPCEGWFRLSAGNGLKGPRLYDWASRHFGASIENGLQHWVLFRRNVMSPHDYAYYFCLAPAESSMDDLAMAAGLRWSIEVCFESAKQETGLDEYEVRSWHGWYRHITLSMLALLFLSMVRWKMPPIHPDESQDEKGG